KQQARKKCGNHVTLIDQQSKCESRNNTQIKLIHIKTYTNCFKRMLFGTWDTYQKAKKLQADVYHFHDPALMFVGWLLKKNDNVVVYDIHEDYVTSILQKEYMKKPVKKMIAVMYKLLEKLFTRHMELCSAEKYYNEIYKDRTCILNYPTSNETIINHKRQRGRLENKLLYTGNVTYDRGALTHARIPRIDGSISVHFIGKCASSIAEEMYATAGDRKDRLIIE